MVVISTSSDGFPLKFNVCQRNYGLNSGVRSKNVGAPMTDIRLKWQVTASSWFYASKSYPCILPGFLTTWVDTFLPVFRGVISHKGQRCVCTRSCHRNMIDVDVSVYDVTRI